MFLKKYFGKSAFVFFLICCVHTQATSNDAASSFTMSTAVASSINAVGTQQTTGFYPFLAHSSDNGATLINVLDAQTKLPTGLLANGIFNSVDCNESVCAAAGRYYALKAEYPTIAVSVDEGNTWTYELDASSEHPTAYFNGGAFKSISCNQDVCVTVGKYLTLTAQYPLIAVRNHEGTWSYTLDSNTNLPALYSTGGVFSSINCQENFCVAVGSYSTATGQYPMIAVSKDKGQSWTYTLDAGAKLPNSYQNNGVFNKVSCYENTCSAVGEYSTPHANYPMIAVSTNAGSSWTYALDAHTVLPALFANDGSFTSVSCDLNVCSAVGSYSTNHNAFPMIAASTDTGKTWKYTLDASKNLPHAFLSAGFLNAVSCQKNMCYAVGSYTADAIQYLLIATSSDSGSTWKYSIDSSTNLPLSFYNNGVFNAISCKENVCSAAGSYLTAISSIYGFIATSEDYGVTWKYTNAIMSSFFNDIKVH